MYTNLDMMQYMQCKLWNFEKIMYCFSLQRKLQIHILNSRSLYDFNALHYACNANLNIMQSSFGPLWDLITNEWKAANEHLKLFWAPT